MEINNEPAANLRLRSEGRSQERLVSNLSVFRSLAQSVYLLSIVSAMLGWIWLLASIGMELFS
jgi:hypothetical protein